MKTFLAVAVLASCLAMSYANVNQEKVYEKAYELLARASSTSEVLTLNLTNVFILGILALLITGLGFFIPGLGGGIFDNSSYSSYNARSNDVATGIQNSDLVGGMCFVMYTSGSLEKLSCVQRTACEDPKAAAKYLQAGKLWHKMHKLMKIIPFNEGYETIMNAVQDATEHSVNGGDCSIYNW